MTDRIIEHRDNNSSMPLVVGVVLLILTVMFFMFDGASLLSGRNTGANGTNTAPSAEGGSIKVEVPEEININTE